MLEDPYLPHPYVVYGNNITSVQIAGGNFVILPSSMKSAWKYCIESSKLSLSYHFCAVDLELNLCKQRYLSMEG